MNDEDIISVSEFARKLGVDEKLIRRGIINGKIKDGVITIKGKSKIIFSTALIEAKNAGIGLRISGNVIPDKPEKKTKSIGSNKLQTNVEIPKTKDISNIAGESLSYAEALKKEKNYVAGIKELEFLEKKGTLVNKSAIDSQLFEFHQEVTESLLTIPDRIVDTLLSFDSDRNKIHKLIYDSIWIELDKYRKYII